MAHNALQCWKGFWRSPDPAFPLLQNLRHILWLTWIDWLRVGVWKPCLLNREQIGLGVGDWMHCNQQGSQSCSGGYSVPSSNLGPEVTAGRKAGTCTLRSSGVFWWHRGAVVWPWLRKTEANTKEEDVTCKEWGAGRWDQALGWSYFSVWDLSTTLCLDPSDRFFLFLFPTVLRSCCLLGLQWLQMDLIRGFYCLHVDTWLSPPCVGLPCEQLIIVEHFALGVELSPHSHPQNRSCGYLRNDS